MRGCTKRKLVFSLAGLLTISSLSILSVKADYVYSTKDGAQILNDGIRNSEEYQTWYEAQWNDQETGEMDTGRVILTPGKNEKSLNFAWYSEEKGIPQVRISTYEDMHDAQVFTGTAEDIQKTNLLA